MSDKEMIDYYKNRFQILLLENNEINKQLELHKTLSSMKEDIIQEQNKIIDVLNRRIKINDGITSDRKSKKVSN